MAAAVPVVHFATSQEDENKGWGRKEFEIKTRKKYNELIVKSSSCKKG